MRIKDEQLKIQAYLDGELSGREASAVRDLIAEDPAARELFEELSTASELLREEDGLFREVPESRNAYWRAIQRQIESRPRPSLVESFLPVWGQWLWKYRVPASGIAALLLLAGVAMNQWTSTPEPPVPAYVESVEPLPGLTTMSYFNPNEEIAVVWISAEGNSDLP